MAEDPQDLFSEEQDLSTGEQDETVQRAVRARIRVEALRQLDTVDTQSDDSRMAPLTPLDGAAPSRAERRPPRHTPTKQ